jgi:hypothetical protein
VWTVIKFTFFPDKYIRKQHNLHDRFLINLFMWSGTKIYKYVALYNPGGDEVSGITFSNDKNYIDNIDNLYCD